MDSGHTFDTAYSLLHNTIAMIIASTVTALHPETTQVWVIVAFYVMGGCFGAIAQVLFVPSSGNGDSKKWDGAKFIANWCASLFVAPGVVYLFKLPENPRIILLVSGSCAVGAVYLIRFIRRSIASKTKGDE